MAEGNSLPLLERTRIEKAAADCGFEMTPRHVPGGLELRSARFPEYITLTGSLEAGYALTSSIPVLLDLTGTHHTVHVRGYTELYDALSRASARARTLPNRVAETFRAESASLPRTTEAERLVVQRVGQNLFRSALLEFFQGRCCVTGLAVPELLRASHIKPWADCASDDERLDVFNGLLLAPNLDALFDGGWITFDVAGHVLVSPGLPADALETLGVTAAWRIQALSPMHGRYLVYHRERVFRQA
jgi:putative restriction endonuclease